VTVVALAPGLVLAAAGVLWAAHVAGRRAAVRSRLSGPVKVSEGIGSRLPPPPALVARALEQAGVAGPELAWICWVCVFLGACGTAAVLAGSGLAMVAAVAGTVGPWVFLRAHRGRAGARLERDLPAVLEAVARSLRSGASLRQSVEEASTSTTGPLGLELRQVAAAIRGGSSVAAALDDLARRRREPGVALAVTTLCLGSDTGGPQARAIDGVAQTLRVRLALAQEVRALASQARMSAAVIALAPVGFGLFAAATDARTFQLLLHTSLGLAMLAIGLMLDGLGWLWMQRLCRVPS
jgi:tight adherence protein B